VAAADLNVRQRAYLQAILETDQAIEAEMRQLRFSRFRDAPEPSEWRWLEYSEPVPIINKPASRLYVAIKKAVKIDQGTGSTFTALADRGLIQVQERGPDHNTHIRMTPPDASSSAPGPVQKPTRHHQQAPCANGTGGRSQRPTPRASRDCLTPAAAMGTSVGPPGSALRRTVADQDTMAEQR
jgi:hypothetical protein